MKAGSIECGIRASVTFLAIRDGLGQNILLYLTLNRGAPDQK
jgi:hypothetical protein